MKKLTDSQQVAREALADFLVRNPMSLLDFSKAAGVGYNTIRRFFTGTDLTRAKPMFKILNFIREYKK